MNIDKEIQEQEREIYTVSELNHTARDILESHFPAIWVEGEISNFSCPSSGHMYFSLKDQAAQIRSAFFRGRNRSLNFIPEDGMHVLVRANVSLYEPRGDYQLIIEYMEQAGDGVLQRAFEQLKHKLREEGLFAEIHKKAIPKLPKCIGVITSSTGAAVRDILTVLKRRFPAIPIIIYPTQVQGDAAAPLIVKSIETANRRKECDVLIISRGGGSLEDLWPFNEEIVARAIFASDIPIVSGVGHEVDFTITDFVADHRCPTPSAAAEFVSPDQNEWMQTIDRIESQLQYYIKKLIERLYENIQWLQKRLRHPNQQLREYQQQLANLNKQLQRNVLTYLTHLTSRLDQYHLQLQRHNPLAHIHRLMSQFREIEQQLIFLTKSYLADQQKQLETLMRGLNTVSPLATLERGYAIVKDHKTNKVIDDVTVVKIGDTVNAKLKNGELICTVNASLGKITS